MRPIREPRIGLLVKVCVPPHVLEVVVPKASEKVVAEPTKAPAPESWSG